MLNILKRFVDEDFGYFEKGVEFEVDTAYEFVTFYLFDNRSSKLVVRMELPPNAKYMNISDWRGYFISHLENILSKTNSKYHDYDVFLSQIKFKDALESFENDIRNTLQQEKVLN